MYICKQDLLNTYFGKLKRGASIQKHPQTEDMCTLGYFRKMTEDELKAYNNTEDEKCSDVVNNTVQTKVVNTKPMKRKRRK